MKRESNTYELKGPCSINTKITSQSEVLSDIRSIRGVTIVSFTPYDKLNTSSNVDYKGELDIKIDNFPFEKFDKKRDLGNIVNYIQKLPAVNYFRVELETLLEHLV
jgi:hypothetical protein